MHDTGKLVVINKFPTVNTLNHTNQSCNIIVSLFFKPVADSTCLNFQPIHREAKSAPVLGNKYANVNFIDLEELLPLEGQTILLGEGPYGRYLFKNFNRSELPVVIT